MFIDKIEINGKLLTVKVKSGVRKKTYRVSCKVVTANDNKLEDIVDFNIV